MLAGRGHSVLDEIIQCRFTRAERLLRETSLPLKTIVDLAGFGSPENMRQVFLARVKLSPLDYRRQVMPKNSSV
jgi:transcriptional regulator GlxA family with amidase domain